MLSCRNAVSFERLHFPISFFCVEKHETTKAVLEKQINELKQQKQNLNNKKLNFYLLTVIDCILFLYILYKNKDYIF